MKSKKKNCFFGRSTTLRHSSFGKLELFSFINLVSGEANDVKLTSEDANSFLSPIHNIVSRTLNHECYVEGCTFEEVAEVKGTNEEAVILPSIKV